MNELDRIEIRRRLLPYAVPAPRALLTNAVSVATLHDHELPSHYEMARTVHQKLRSWTPAIFVGYNSIGFDEKMVRQTLYQTLHPPYLTNTLGNSRSDALKMVQAASVFAPNALVFPLKKGKSSFKLEHVATANGFEEHKAHDALGDVEATIYVCKLIRERALSVWTTFIRFNKKLQIETLLRKEPVLCLTEFYAGPHSWLVTAIGRNPGNDNEICVVRPK